MAEKRNLERVRCYYYLKIYNIETNQDVGSMIDITTKGMKVISENSFQVNSTHDFRIQLPQGYIYGDYFDIKAEVRWCNKNEQEQYYEQGFKFISQPHKGIYVIKMLIQDFKSNNLL